MDPPGGAERIPGFREAVAFWAKLGLISFGGPAGQIAIMHRELVETKRWIGEGHFLHAVNLCMLLPGPEAQQLATYLGWRLHGAKGGVVAGGLFILPSALLLLGLSWLYIAGGNVPWLAGLFHGLSAAVVAVVFEAVGRIGKRALRGPALWAVAAGAFALIFWGKVSFVLIIALAGLIGFFGHAWFPALFPPANRHAGGAGDGAGGIRLPAVPLRSVGGYLRVAAIGLALWWAPVMASSIWLGPESIQTRMGLFFSKAALVTFGGAYAVLPYVAQEAVEAHGWLTHDQMMSGLALAETTPGPLIMVLQFVGFVGAWQAPGGLDPLLSGVLGAMMTTWVTFLPSFLFVFLLGPQVERLGELPKLSAALTGITAAVVGVILNLAVTLGIHVVWPGAGQPPDLPLVLLAVASFVALHRFRVNLLWVIAVCGFLSLFLPWPH